MVALPTQEQLNGIARAVKAFLQAVAQRDEREVALWLHTAGFDSWEPGTRAVACLELLGLEVADIQAIVDAIQPGQPFPGSTYLYDPPPGIEVYLRTGEKECRVGVWPEGDRWRVMPIPRGGPVSRLVERVRRPRRPLPR